jgi:hypothetical protein
MGDKALSKTAGCPQFYDGDAKLADGVNKQITYLHRQAMEQTDYGDIACRNGDLETSHCHLTSAFELEMQCVSLIRNTDSEPTRSVLMLSAAHLAVNIGRQADALGLIEEALDGNPPGDIKRDLLDLRAELAK